MRVLNEKTGIEQVALPREYLIANIADVFLTAILSNVPRLVALVTPAKTFIQHPLVLAMRVKHHYARNTQKI